MLKNIYKLKKDREDLLDIIERYRAKLEKVSWVDYQALNLLLTCHQTRLWDIEAEIAERSRTLAIAGSATARHWPLPDNDTGAQVSA